MMVPCKLRFGFEAQEGGSQQQLTLYLVDDDGQVLQTLDPVQLTPGQDVTFGPVHVSATIDSTLETGGHAPPVEPPPSFATSAASQGQKPRHPPTRPNQPPSK